MARDGMERTAAQKPGPEVSGTTPTAGIPYVEKEGCLWWHKPSADGGTLIKLCNFSARITEEVSLDDGSGRPTLAFKIEGYTEAGEPLPKVTVPAAEFESLKWVAQTWGTRATILAGQARREHLRTAIQLLSGHPPKKRVLEHTGWTQHEGEPVFLHAGGALGAQGPVQGFEVSLEGRLGLYDLPSPAVGEDLQAAWKTWLSMLDAAPIEVTGPLWLSGFRAALGRTLFSLHLVGTPQAGKSELASLVTGLFGAGLDPKNFLASWEDTTGSIERTVYLAKNVVALVDDFRPHGTMNEVAQANSKADRIFRGAFNSHGRGRLRADATARPDYYSRGLILSTGEDLPTGMSLQSRVLMLRLAAGGTDWRVVSRLQEARTTGVLASLMSAFLVWVAGRKDPLFATMLDEAESTRRRWAGKSGRTSDIVSDLFSALVAIREFALDQGLSTVEELNGLTTRLSGACVRLLRDQDEHLDSSDPAEQFKSLLSDVLMAGRGYFKQGKPGEIPPALKAYVRDEDNRGAECLGYIDPIARELWIIPGVGYAVVSDLSRRTGRSLGLSESQLWKRLSEKGWVIHQEAGRNKSKRTVMGGPRASFLVLKMGLLTDSFETSETTETEPGSVLVSDVPDSD